MPRMLMIVVLGLGSVAPLTAGGPAYVAGSGFDASVRGQALTWAGSNVAYYTDQGDLSPVLSGLQADLLVGDVVSRWTAIPGTSLTVLQGGHLAEDVSGANVIANPDGTFLMPDDILPTASATPVGIVYDFDGRVTEALLGVGAGGIDSCFSNTVYGGPDNFGSDAHFTHALVVINGVCVSDTSKFPDLRYRLVRTLGRVLGLGWSQANPNVLTRTPPPTADDFQGFPLMHFIDPVTCVPITICYPDAEIPKMDDRAALTRLYPKTSKMGRIRGTVWFTDAAGNRVEPMQGVNVVARRIESGQPSRKFVATSVSGFAFRGDAGNPVLGTADADGRPCDFFGSDDTALQGSFDLGGLEIPEGSNSAKYQLSIEAIDRDWAQGAGPYAPTQVAPSGTFSPVLVTVSRGDDVSQDIFMQRSAVATDHPGGEGTYAAPAKLPTGGGWGAWISQYGDSDWFQFAARANRTASVTATALNESGMPTQDKLMPVIGIWQLSDQSGDPAPAATSTAFNTFVQGTSRLDAQFFADDVYRIGVADLRGDGRPDFFYTASILYADSVTPVRVGMQGGPVALKGLGFNSTLQVAAGAGSGNLLSASANDMQAVLPSGRVDGVATLMVSDPDNGAFSQMIDALTYGAAASDLLLGLQLSEPATPVGAVAANPLRVRAVASDGVTPVAGATIAWSTTNGATLTICGGASTCSVLTDESGIATTGVVPTLVGTSIVTAALAPASYSPPQSKQATLVGTVSNLDLAAISPTRWIARGATVDLSLFVRALKQGAPQSNVGITFRVEKGSATLSAGTGTTNDAGYASTVAHLSNHSADVQVSACVTPGNSPCQTFTMFATASSSWALEPVSGSFQIVPAGQAFRELVVRATDGPNPSNPVTAAPVTFDVTLMRLPGDSHRDGHGDDGRGGDNGMPVILGTYQALSSTDDSGLARLSPTTGDIDGYCDVLIAVRAGSATSQFHLQVVSTMGEQSQPTHLPRIPVSPRQARNQQLAE